MSAFELRTYQIAPGKIQDIVEIMRSLVQPILPDHDMEGIGDWAKPDGKVFYYVVRHRDLHVIASDWDSFHADPRWKIGMAERKSKELIVTQVETTNSLGTPDLPPAQ